MWHVIKIQINRERAAKEALISYFGDEQKVYIPFTYKDKDSSKIKPLFPGYGFVDLVISMDGDSIGEINRVAHCNKLLRFGDHYPTVTDSYIEMLKSRESEGFHRTQYTHFREHETVRLKSEQWKHYNAVISKLRGSDRVDLLIDHLGKQMTMKNVHIKDIASID